MNKKIAIYSRKSKFTGKGESIENQIELCKQYIQSHYEDIKDDDIVVFEDEGFSGGNTRRPQFQEMIRRGTKHEFSAVVCYRLDRISRNISDFVQLIDEFSELGISFISIKEQFDTTSSMGKAMMYIASIFSQLERETTAERIRDNMHELAKTGRWLGGITPTGYKSTSMVGSISVDGKQRKAFKLDIVKDEAEKVKLIFNKFLEMKSLSKTETYLLQNHISTKNGNEFTRFSIKSILRNPVYLVADENAWKYFNNKGMTIYADKNKFDGKHGIMCYNKTLQKAGKSNKIRNPDEWILSVGKHKPIISSENWLQAQKLLEQNSSKSYRKPKSNVALLSGLLYCGNCDKYMRPKLSSRLNSSDERIYSYLCETKERSRMQNCQMNNPNGNELDYLVCEKIKKLSENYSNFTKELENAKKNIFNKTGSSQEQISKLEKEVKDNEVKINSLVEAISLSKDSPAITYITNQINELDAKNITLTKTICELKNASEEKALSDVEFEMGKNLLQSFSETFDTMSVEEKRSALKVLINKIVWDGNNVHIYLLETNDSVIKSSQCNLEPQ